MLPVPMVAASAVMNAWNGLSAPPASRSSRATKAASAAPKRRTWTTRYRMVRKAPLPKRSITSHGTNSASASDWITRDRVSSTTSEDAPRLGPVHHDRRATHPARARRGEERHHVGHFLRASEPAEGQLAPHELGDALRIGL